jgi:hypothetical protein
MTMPLPFLIKHENFHVVFHNYKKNLFPQFASSSTAKRYGGSGKNLHT